MNKPVSWEKYIDTRISRQTCADSQRQCASALSEQRRNIGGLVNTLGAKAITCLGSGYLNDLPVNILFARDNQVTLVDWLNGVSQEGVASQVIQKYGDEYHCLFCDKNVGASYCKSFTNELLSEGVCTAFVAIEESGVRCKNYQPNVEPRFLQCDITAGYGQQFAKAIQKKVGQCKTPKDAFIKAIRLCNQLEAHDNPIPVNDSSMDLVTSSMVVSQFDNEPYEYFALLLEQCFGGEQIMLHEKTLRPFMEQLRTKLFVEQVRRHMRELHRMVKKDGNARVYFSVELFRSISEERLYFMVQDIPKAMDVVRDYFLFDLESVPGKEILNHVEIDGATSVIQNYVLAPRVH